MTRKVIPSTKRMTHNLAVLAFACALPAFAATSITTCTVITAPGDYVLNADLACSGDGIDIQASGVSLNLNGHLITQTGGATSVGINVLPDSSGTRRNHVAIEGPGLIQKFFAGVVFDTTDYCQIGLVTLSGNSNYGILVNNSTYMTVSSNVAVKNGAGAGVNLSNTSASTVEYNDVSGNGDGLGITQPSSPSVNNTVNNNTASGNANSGISIYGSGTRLSSNTTNGNPFGLVLYGTGNQATNNTSRGNTVTDLYDANAGCAGNVWSNNVSFLRNLSCVQ